MSTNPDEFDPEYVTRVSSALLVALGTAKTLVELGDFGPELEDIVKHARELHAIMIEQLDVAPPTSVDSARDVANEMGVRLAKLERQLGKSDGPAPSRALH
jgi:hypothetical protein